MPTDDKTPPPQTVTPRPRVLVVDDEPSIRTVARLMLERAGYSVDDVGSAVEAVTKVALAARPYSVILLDVTLPDRNGIELLPDLRLLAAHSRIVLTSGRAEEDVPDHGADGYLPKPFSRDQLVAAIRTVTALTPR